MGRELTMREATEMLTEYAAVVASRDDRVREALRAGLTKNRIHVLSGLGRMTIDRILSSGPDGSPPAHDLANTR
jgi:hypothetical protein